MSWMRHALPGAPWIAIGGLLSGCFMPSAPSRPLGRTETGRGSFALENSSRERGILRFGDSLHMRIGPGDVQLASEKLYRFRVTNTRSESVISEGDVVTHIDGT